MSFISLQYILFLPLVASLYFSLPHAYRWMLLLLASCVFYMAFIPKYLLVLAFSISIDYIAGIQIERTSGRARKAWLWCSIVLNLGLLGVFKYYNFFTGALGLHSYWKLVLPLGLSFHTFQAMAYNFEIYHGRQKAERHFGIYALYILFFPQLVAGPIERPQHMLPQLREKHSFSSDDTVAGLRLILWGFFRKLVIADNFARVVDPVFAAPAEHSPAALCLASVCFALQIYADFSAYTSIAIGSARILGFQLVQNFRFPYQSTSIRAFWTRWHISLSSWFRDYLYIPLGGNRKTFVGWCLAIMIVFVLSGLWHGANWTFMIWGAWNGVLLIAGRLLAPLFAKMPLRHTMLYTISAQLVCFALLTIGWIFFRAASVADGIFILKQISTLLPALQHGFSSPAFTINIQQASVGSVRTCYLLILLFPLLEYIVRRRSEGDRLLPDTGFLRWTVYYAALLLIFLAGDFSEKDFIYFQF